MFNAKKGANGYECNGNIQNPARNAEQLNKRKAEYEKFCWLIESKKQLGDLMDSNVWSVGIIGVGGTLLGSFLGLGSILKCKNGKRIKELKISWKT